MLVSTYNLDPFVIDVSWIKKDLSKNLNKQSGLNVSNKHE